MNTMVKWFQRVRACVLVSSAVMLFQGCGQKDDSPQLSAQAAPQLARPTPVPRLAAAPQASPAEAVAARPAAQSKLPVYEVRMKEEDMQAMDSNPYSPQLYPATFSSGGEVFENVKIRYRGAWSCSGQKKPLKIFFNDDKP